MFVDQNNELICIEDLFENKEYVFMKATLIIKSKKTTEISVGIKDMNDDIVKIICVDRYEN